MVMADIFDVIADDATRHPAVAARSLRLAAGGAIEQELQDVATRAVRDHVEDVRHVLRLAAPPPEYHDNA